MDITRGELILGAWLTAFCMVMPNVFSIIFAVPHPHTKMCISSHAQSSKPQITVTFIRHPRNVSPQYGTVPHQPSHA